MKVYISGKITDNKDYKKYFEEAAQRVRDMGEEPVVPIENGTPENQDLWKKWEDYLKKDIKILMDCDAIYLICENIAGVGKGWKESRGAIFEKDIAERLNYNIMYSDPEKKF